MIDKVIAETNTENLLHPNVGPYWGPNRLSALAAVVWHISDHYGQLHSWATTSHNVLRFQKDLRRDLRVIICCC